MVAVTTPEALIPPETTLIPLRAVIRPIESTFLTSSYVNVPAIETLPLTSKSLNVEIPAVLIPATEPPPPGRLVRREPSPTNFVALKTPTCILVSVDIPAPSTFVKPIGIFSYLLARILLFLQITKEF